MRKVFAVILAVAMMCGLFGCGEGSAAPAESESPTVSEVFSAKTVVTIEAAITMLDMFLESKVDAEEARGKLYELADGLGTDDEHDEMAQLAISAAGTSLLLYSEGDADKAHVQELRDALYDYLISGDFTKSFGLDTFE